jgi:hypothetical protein
MAHRGTPSTTPMLRTGEIALNGLRYPAKDPVRYQPTARFGRRVTFGDASRDSDDLLSVDIMFDYSGGGQVETRNEGSDQGRFWFATLHTRDPYALMLAREVESFAFENDVCGRVGDLTVGGVTTFWAYDDDGLRAWDEDAGDFDAALGGTVLGGVPPNPAFEFGATGAGSTPVLWIPLGTVGYQTFNGTTLNAVVATPKAVAFCEFDDKLWALGTDGVLSSWNGATWDAEGQLDKRHTPKNLILFYASDDGRALAAVTNRGLWAFNEQFDVFVETDLTLDPHPDNGLASANWSGGGGSTGANSTARGDLYYSAATQNYRYVLGSTISPIGPQRDQGLPGEYSKPGSAIISLAAEHNGLYCLVKGAVAGVVGEDTPDAQVEPLASDPDVFSSGTEVAPSMLMVWTGIGWHTVWVGEGTAGEPGGLFVSAGGGAHRVWWSYGGQMLSLNLPTDMHLPRQGLVAGTDRFQPTGYLETGWFDAQMAGFDKLASHFQVNLDRCRSGCTVVVRYQRDFDDSWTTLGDTLTQRGKRMLSFGFEGLSFQRIRFRIEMTSDDPLETPLIDSMILHFTKIPHEAGSWEVTLNMDFNTEEWGRSPEEMAHEIDELLVDSTFTRFTLKDTDFRVRVAAASGVTYTGERDQRVTTLSLIEVVDEADIPLEDDE